MLAWHRQTQITSPSLKHNFVFELSSSTLKVVQIMEAQMHPLTAATPRFIQLIMPLPPLKPMAQSRRGVTQIMEAQMHPLALAIPRFIQLILPLPPLKPMDQSRRGVTQSLEALLVIALLNQQLL